MKREVMVIGHKGAAAEAPENTLASFARAIELGAPGIECDIRATADGVPVVIHDASLDRTTDRSGEVSALTLPQVREADAGSGMAAFRGELVPTLEELLTLARHKVLLALEYKSLDAVAPSVPLLRRYEAAQWCTAWAFSAEVLAELKRLAPELSRTRNVGRIDGWDKVLDTARELECVGVSLAHGLVTPERVADAHRAGLTVYTWTANQPEDWRRLLGCGVDAIVTDDPRGLLAYLRGSEG